MITFELKDMSCGHCVGVINKTIADIDKQAKVNVDLPTHKITIESTFESDEFAEALTAAGYPPSA